MNMLSEYLKAALLPIGEDDERFNALEAAARTFSDFSMAEPAELIDFQSRLLEFNGYRQTIRPTLRSLPLPRSIGRP